MPARLRALLATARIANVPSVVSNVLTGMLLSGVVFSYHLPKWNQQTIFPIIAACCLYVAGNFLNDWYDVTWDQEHRPERAIPSGLFPRPLYLGIAMVLILAGASMSWQVSKTVFFTYSIILAFVVAYTLLHKLNAFSIWIMGACRAGLYALGIGAMSAGYRVLYDTLLVWPKWMAITVDSVILLPLLGLLTYIAGISLLARFESRPSELGSTKWFASLLLLFPLLTHTAMWVSSHYFGNRIEETWFGIIGIFPFLFWTLYVILSKATVGQKVARLLAGICLVDAVFWLSLGLLFFMNRTDSTLWFSFTPLLAFFLALLLQKLAPAT